MKSICFLILVNLIGSSLLVAQNTTTIGSEELNTKAVLTLVAPDGDQGFILPVVENKASINPGESESGMLVYERNTAAVFLWNGAEWVNITTGGNAFITQLNDIGDVNAALPADGQVLQYQTGTGWVATDLTSEYTDDQALLLTEDILSIEDGEGSVDLAVYRQDINLTGTELSITDGSTIDLAPIIPPGGSDDQTAAEVTYDNANSGLTATDVQGALNELAATPPGSSPWIQNSENIYYDQGNVGIGTTDPASRLEILIPAENTTTAKGLVIDHNYTGPNANYGTDVRVNGEATGSKIGSNITVENGTGAKAGQTIQVDQQAPAIGYGQFIQLLSNNGAQASAGISLANGGTGTGDKYGILNGVGGTDSKNTGIYSTIQGGTALGIHSVITNNTGNSTGVLSEISGNTSPVSRGFHSILSEGGEKIGFDSEIVQDVDVLNSFGFRSNITNNSGVAEQYGFYSTISGQGDGDQIGVASNLPGTGLGRKFGLWSEIYGGTGEKTGVYSRVLQPGDELSYGFYSEMVNNGQEPAYGYYTRFDENALGDGDKTGAFYNMKSRGFAKLHASEAEIILDGESYATGHRVRITGASRGGRVGFSSRLTGGDSGKIGVVSEIVQNFPRTTYGFESTITNNSIGPAIGVRLHFVDNVSRGISYGIVSTGDSLNTFNGSIRAGYQVSARRIKAGSWHFQDDGSNPANLSVYKSNGALGGFFSVNDGDYYNISDRNLKKNIQPIGNVISDIMRLNPSRYQFKNNPSDAKNIGFIAQDVREVFPELVQPTNSGSINEILTLNYNGFGVLAIKAIQEQQEIIESQEERIRKLEEQVEKLLKELK